MLFKLKSKVQKGQLALVGLLVAATAVSCTTPTTAAIPTQPTEATTLAARQVKARNQFKNNAQTADPGDNTPQIEGFEDEEMWEGVDWFGIAAEALSMEDEALWDALMEGQSIAGLAEANGVDPTSITSAITTAETEWINGLVSSGEITQEEANEWLANLAEEVQDFITDSSWALWEGVDWFTVAAETIGVDEETLFEAESIAAAATAAGVEPQAVIDAIVNAETAWINELVSSGDMTQEDADAWLSDLAEYAAEFVNESWMDVGEFDEFDEDAFGSEDEENSNLSTKDA